MNVLVVGAGYTGHRLALDLRASGAAVVGTRRRGEGAGEPYPIYGYDLNRPGTLEGILEDCGWRQSRFSVVLAAGPPLRDSVDESLARLEGFLEVLPVPRLERLIYISSTSVYGDADGDWVDESSPLDPVSRSGELKVLCEEMLEDHLGSDAPLIRVRPGGIYGPGRNGPDRYLDSDYTLVGKGNKWTNRIHVVDLVRVLARTLTQEAPDVLNAVDGRPVRLRELVEYLYRETGRDPARIERISWAEAERRYSEMRLGLLKPSKRVSSRRLRERYGFRFLYPDVLEGMRSLLSE